MTLLTVPVTRILFKEILGPEVNNCQPIVVTFEEFYDRDEILKIAKLKRF